MLFRLITATIDIIKVGKSIPDVFSHRVFLCVNVVFYALMLCVAAQYISVLFGIELVHDIIPWCAVLVDAYSVPLK